MSKQIRDLIISRGGPISVADFMRVVSANRHSIVDRQLLDDLETHLESRLLGKLLGGYIFDLWKSYFKPKRLNLIQLGPGMGILMGHIIRSTARKREFSKSLHIYFIESSQALRTMQHKALREDQVVSISFNMELQEVPRGVPSVIIAHEFYKMLPVRQFVYEERDCHWHEKLVNISNSNDQHFHFVFDPTVTSKDLVEERLSWSSPKETKGFWTTDLKHVELCPQAWEQTKEILCRIKEDKGVAYIIDTGEENVITNSLQARKEDGQYVDVMEDPGSANLTATVDFAAIKRVVKEVDKLHVIGPNFLRSTKRALNTQI